jgi:hypothetical protein
MCCIYVQVWNPNLSLKPLVEVGKTRSKMGQIFKIRIGTARFYLKNLTRNHIPGSICVKQGLKTTVNCSLG